MATDLEKEAPNVVTETLFRQLLAKGYQAEVVCRGEAYLKSAVWYGEWIVRAVNPERTVEKLLINIPRRVSGEEVVNVKVFKTINGLSTFMHRVGFTHLQVPYFQGGRSTQSLPDELLDPDHEK